MAQWTADVGNDPDHEFELVIELLEDGVHRGRLRQSRTGQLVMEVYGGKGFSVPLDWLRMIADRAVQEAFPSASEPDR